MAKFPIRVRINSWILAALLVSVLVVLPLLVIVPAVFMPGDTVWVHIVKDLLPRYISNTLLLMLGVAFITFMLGVSTAWLTTVYRFPGRNFFSWALVLPMAIPAYINGFTWAGILDYTSPVYVFARNYLGIETGPYLFFNILSLPGATIILSLALYPYVFLISRAFFIRQSASMLEVSASLGRQPLSTFFTVVLPLARPAIVAGISLALMEVLNEYGLVRYFGVDTFTTGIFTAWFSFGNLPAAMRLSAYLMVFVLALIGLERLQRGNKRFDISGSHYRPMQGNTLYGRKAVAAIAICALPLLPGFLIPVLMLGYWSIQTAHIAIDAHFLVLLRNSFMLAGVAALTVVVMAISVAFAVRSYPDKITKWLARLSTMGYALPGAVVAIGILVVFVWTDGHIISMSGLRGPVITGTWVALIYAYAVRFMAVGYNSIESGMATLPPSLDEASRSLGKSGWGTLTSVLLPLLKAPVLGAALLVFIDVLKELPLTLILRPFNFDTMAIRAFEYASDERIAEAAPAALIIVLIGMVPAFLLNRMTGRVG